MVAGFALALLASSAFAATAPAQDDKHDQADPGATSIGEVVVTGSMIRARQGGAQDINHFRGEAAQLHVPFPDTVTVEGLLGDYDVQIKDGRPCAQTFCLTAEAMRASLIGAPDTRMFVGLGFATNIDAATWRREPLNLVAVVDHSGSMSGTPLELVKKSLHQIVRQLRNGDQITIVLFDGQAEDWLDATRIEAGAKGKVDRRIDEIPQGGSTDLQAGLRLGYQLADATAGSFRGITRVMVFTDERPNVEATDAGSFMGMARTASARGIGLTTIGFGQQFDAALATKVSSVRGGNLYFMRDESDVKSVFEDKLDTMVAELAHDVQIVLTPDPGYKIAGVYGVPDELLHWQDADAVSIEAPTAFFSTNGGGIFVALASAPGTANLPAPPLSETRPPMRVALSYTTAADGLRATDALAVAAPPAEPSADLRLAHTLVDEYLALRDATTRYHRSNDVEGAWRIFTQLSAQLNQNGDGRLKPERDMVGALLTQTAFLSGHSAEAPRGASRAMGLIGRWEVLSVDGAGESDLRRGDRLALSDENELTIYRKSRSLTDSDETEDFRANDTQLSLDGSNILFDYRVSGRSLTLSNFHYDVTIRLRRVEAPDVAVR